MFIDFIAKLEKRLSETLPGKKVQQRMLPKVLTNDGTYTGSTGKSKKGSVLILLFPHEGKVFLPLMLRPDYEGVHGGQVSFPGGKMEAGDADLTATALREAEEEIGVKSNDIRVIGRLTQLHIFASNFIVSPIVGYSLSKPRLVPNPYEVEEIIEADLSRLLDDRSVKSKDIRARGGMVRSPYFDVNGHMVWGATAMMLSEFLYLVRETGKHKLLS